MSYTATINPNPGPAEVRSVDGYTERGGASEAWATLRDGAANISSDTAATHLFQTVCTAGPADKWQAMGRFHMLFHPLDASPLIPTTAVVQAARLLVYVGTKHDDFGTDSVVATPTNPASDTQINTLAHVTVSDTKLSDEIAMSAISSTSWVTLTLNAAGLAAVEAAIAAVGPVKLCLRYSSDVDNVAPAWGASDYEQLPVSSADSASDPKLEIDFYIGPGYATASITAQKTNAADTVTADQWAVEVFS